MAKYYELTPAQEAILQLLIQHTRYWQTTNDLSSPTHACDLEADMRQLMAEHDLPEARVLQVERDILNLLASIRHCKA
jgi:hypothetical protein